MVLVGDCNVFKAFSRLLISSCMKIGSDIFYLLDFNNMLYSFYKNTSLSCTTFSLFSFANNHQLWILLIVRYSSHWRWKYARWTQKCVDLWNDLGFSLCAVLSVCHMVTISDGRKKSEMEVSANWCHKLHSACISTTSR